MRTEDRTSAVDAEETELETRAEAEPRGPAPLFAAEDADGYRRRWAEVQARFVDAPPESVAAADKLVTEVIQQLSAVFAEQQRELESHLDRSGKLSTEDLRLALRRYRSFFDRLLSM